MIHLLMVHASTSRSQGGTVTFLRNLASRLSPDVFRVTLLFLEPGGISEDFKREGFHVEVIETGRLRRVDRVPRVIASIRRLIKTLQVNLVFSNGAFEHIYGGLAAWTAGVPALWYCHGSSTGFDPVRRAALAVPARMVVTHSAYTASLLPDRRGIPVVVVPLGVETKTLRTPAAIRQQIGVDETTPIISMVGVFMLWKGQDVFIRAAALIRKQVPEARFLLVGDAPFERHRPYADSLRELVAELDLGNAVSFLGFRADGPDVMAASDIVVHASVEPEPFGIVLLEAMATGRALVTTATGGAREVVLAGESALVVPPGDAVALAESCVRLLKDPALRQRVAAAGQRRVRKEFTIEPMIQRLAERFEQASQRN